MPVIKLSDEEATLFFTDQFNQNNPIQIFLEVRESNQAAIALYEKAEFHQIDLRKNYYPVAGGTREHAVIMVRTCSDDFAALFK